MAFENFGQLLKNIVLDLGLFDVIGNRVILHDIFLDIDLFNVGGIDIARGRVTLQDSVLDLNLLSVDGSSFGQKRVLCGL